MRRTTVQGDSAGNCIVAVSPTACSLSDVWLKLEATQCFGRVRSILLYLVILRLFTTTFFMAPFVRFSNATKQPHQSFNPE